MADDIFHQASQNAPVVGVSGILGVALSVLVSSFKKPAMPQDIELAKAEMRTEIAEKYARKDEMTKFADDITYIRQRIDQIADRKQAQ